MAMGVEIPAGVNSLYGAFLAVQAPDWSASSFTLGIVLVTVLVTVGTSRTSTTFPASIGAAAVLALVAFFGNLTVPTIGQLPSSFPAPSFPSVDFSLMRQLLPAAFAVAMLAATESLLSARVAAGMPEQGSYQPDRELVSEGLASIGSDIFGGMPATGAIARTAVNVKSGATSRVFTILHALILGAVVYRAAGLVSHILLTTLAGVLFVTAFRMLSTSSVRKILG